MSGEVRVTTARRQCWCLCGGSIDVKGPDEATRFAIQAFWDIHHGEGHGACPATVAAAARRKARHQ